MKDIIVACVPHQQLVLGVPRYRFNEGPLIVTVTDERLRPISLAEDAPVPETPPTRSLPVAWYMLDNMLAVFGPDVWEVRYISPLRFVIEVLPP